MGFAGARAQRHGNLAYAGEISPREAWEKLKNDPAAVLIDVRTQPEWTFSGEPDLSLLGKDIIRLSWKLFPQHTVNPQFASSLNGLGFRKDAPLFFICRTGGRSLDAACVMTAEGFSGCYNVTDGFEGPLDAESHRGAVAGWKASGLPWRQG